MRAAKDRGLGMGHAAQKRLDMAGDQRLGGGVCGRIDEDLVLGATSPRAIERDEHHQDAARGHTLVFLNPDTVVETWQRLAAQ